MEVVLSAICVAGIGYLITEINSMQKDMKDVLHRLTVVEVRNERRKTD